MIVHIAQYIELAYVYISVLQTLSLNLHLDETVKYLSPVWS